LRLVSFILEVFFRDMQPEDTSLISEKNTHYNDFYYEIFFGVTSCCYTSSKTVMGNKQSLHAHKNFLQLSLCSRLGRMDESVFVFL